MLVGQGSNSALVGDFNARVVLAALRRSGPASKADLARLVGLTGNATGMIARKLEGEGLVRAIGKRRGERGQPATMLEVNPEGALSIGIRIDRTLIEAVLVDLQGGLLDRAATRMLPEPRDAVSWLAGTVAAMLARLSQAMRQRLTGIGVAMPYNLESWLAELDLPADRFLRWDGFDIAPALAAATGLKVVVENDGSAAAVGELVYGAGRAINDFLYLFIGPALGGGVVLGGDYLRGARGNAGDIGMVPVGPSGLASASGRPTILLARASVIALVRHLRHGGVDGDLADAIARRPDLFAEWVEDAVAALAWPVLTGAHLLDVPDIILGGDLPAPALEELATRLALAMQGSVAESRAAPRVLTGRTDAAAALGAASLPLHLNFSPVREGLTAQTQDSEMEVVP